MKKFLIIIILISGIVNFSTAQVNYETRQAMDLFRTNKHLSGDWQSTLSAGDIQGSPYSNDEFITGAVFTTQKLQFVDVQLRYNIYNDQIEFKSTDDEVQAIATPEIIEKVVIGDLNMVYLPYSVSKKIRNGFFTVIDEGKASLFLRQEVVFVKATEPGAYKDAQPAKFEKRPDVYFIKVGTSEAKEVDSKKELLEAFPDKTAQLEKFIKQNKIKTNKQEDLIQLVHFYNSL